MSTATSHPTARTAASSVPDQGPLRPVSRTIIASGWYDPDGAAWEPEMTFEAPIASTPISRPPIEIEGLRERRRS
jgi:hypothetical protein